MAEKTPPGQQLVEAVVQRGTVVHGPVENPTHAGPGEKVMVSLDEKIALQARGVLVDERNGPPAMGIGPKYGLDDEEGPASPSAI